MIRRRKRNGRTRSNSKHSPAVGLSGDDEGGPIKMSCLEIIRAEQATRQRKVGVRMQGEKFHDSLEGVKNLSTNENEERNRLRDITIRMSSRGEDSPSKSHENIMDEYVDERLGKRNQDIAIEKELTAEEKLYTVPDDIRALEDQKNQAHSDPDFSSSSIVEVALPSKYKERNVKATELARQTLDDNVHYSSVGVMNGQYRYAMRPIDLIQVGMSGDNKAVATFKKNQSRRNK